MKFISTLGIRFPRMVVAAAIIATIAAAAQFPQMSVDTDPENMLSEKEFVRVFHHEVKREFGLYDFIVVGVVNEDNENGVFNVETLDHIYEVTEKIKGIDGVITREIIAPSTKDNIRQGSIGEVVFEWLMSGPITTGQEALRIRDEALDNPMFRNTMVSEDGKALCLYVPIARKDQSYRISREILAFIRDLKGSEKYHITGLPVAEDTFGFEMFKQMAISAPLAGLIIFLLMFLFFRRVNIIIAPMIVAVLTVLITMGLLIGFGFDVHIMSSMIPIFLMPIAVLDSVHILSEFFEKYQTVGNKRDTIHEVMNELFTPMLYTSLTSAVGFFSLSFAPIPPVQVFGIFVAVGVMIAWLLTMTFIPAYIILLKEKSLANFGVTSVRDDGHASLFDKILVAIGRFSLYRYKFIIIVSAILVLLSVYGMSRINVNDNPVRWFNKNHPIRVADKVLNHHFAGTYTAYLVLEAEDPQGEVFKEPKMLRYIEGLQEYLVEQGDVGKTTALTDVVKKVYYELLGGDKANNVIPQTKAAVGQCLISYENSHKPDDLWHMTTPGYDKAVIWVQLRSGDNKDMEKVRQQAERYFDMHKPPFAITRNWAGLTFINLVWQNKMVKGMLMNFLGSFIIVFFMMAFLFRSPLRGLISMIPLTITIMFIYSLLGFFGKDYDMPVAVLSALTLGLSIDFAIHFIQRAREIYAANASWEETAQAMFREPARAIVRNALVVAIGFLPLLAAPLVPYKTVGFFMFSIMFVSSIATLFILPAIMTAFQQATFEIRPEGAMCNSKYCIVLSIAVSLAIAYILTGYTNMPWRATSLISVGVVAACAGLCSFLGRTGSCVTKKGGSYEKNDTTV